MSFANSNPRRHKGDTMSPKQRSALMSRIRGRDTGPERILAEELVRKGLSFESQARDLPGTPDFVFREAGIAVFVDGDFWHGWRFSEWRDKLSERWESKIAANRRRDIRNRRLLRESGWQVVRIWEHQIKRDADSCARRVARAVGERDGRSLPDSSTEDRRGHSEADLLDKGT